MDYLSSNLDRFLLASIQSRYDIIMLAWAWAWSTSCIRTLQHHHHNEFTRSNKYNKYK
jgi:hypothetical protein